VTPVDVSTRRPDSWLRLKHTTHCPFAATARVMRAGAWDPARDARSNLAHIGDQLRQFCRAYEATRLHGFVAEIGAPPGRELDLGLSAGLVNWLLRGLAGLDGQNTESDWRAIETTEWQFRFAGVRLFMNLFSRCYPPHHSKHIGLDRGVLVFAQPEQAFDFCGVNPARPSIKHGIRARFAAAGKPYPGRLIDSRVEAHLYVFPLRLDDPPVRWWLADPPF